MPKFTPTFMSAIPYMHPAGIFSYISDKRYGMKFVRAEYTRARAVMSKRIDAIVKAGYATSEKPPMLKDIRTDDDGKMLSDELSKIYSFLSKKSGSLTGIREMAEEFRKHMDETAKAEKKEGIVEQDLKYGGIEFDTPESINEAHRFLIYIHSKVKRKLPGSGLILRHFQSALKGEQVPKYIAKYFKKFYPEFKENTTI